MWRLNGEPALLVRQHGFVVSAYTFAIEAAAIRRVHIMRNPDKLRHTLRLVEALV
jgi:hypothetical protein